MSKDISAALDKLENGDWEGAHEVAQAGDAPLAHWLHAHLHRVEGDPDNADYWYRRARRDRFSGSEEEERDALRAACSPA
ncbi:hypothetical protein [Oceaniglobus trochenteri]|uniref:hypothetical protein n=1 Tax=Oceaniglobus trochenteri TaxID=2763260 RepID=UPI001CFF7105|nr:hypothetical protein [Oceaniglobus trochenteri]